MIKNASWYKDGIRVQMLINRGIGNSHKGSKRWVNKLISSNPVQFDENVERLKTQMAFLGDPKIRLYSCVNPRKFDKAIKMFHHKLIDICDDEEKFRFFLDIRAKFVSCLMQQENRAESNFLLDFDDGMGVIDPLMTYRLMDAGIQTIDAYSTPNGYHIITRPFNPEIIRETHNCEIKKDGLILLHYLK